MIDINGALSKTTSKVFKVAAVIGAITVIAGGYNFYMHNIWIPKVEVLDIDKVDGVVVVKAGSKVIELYGTDVFLIKLNWGIRLVDANLSAENITIELLKNGMIFKKITV